MGMKEEIDKDIFAEVYGPLPAHKCSLTIQHNEHRDFYMTATEWLDDHGMYEFRTAEQRQRAIDSDSIWTLHWYPKTPIGFHAIAAPTLRELLEYAGEHE